MVYWFFAAAFLFGAVLMSLMMVRSLKRPVSLVLGRDAATLPMASIKNEIFSIPYKSITSINSQDVYGNEMVFIKSSVGQSTLSSKGFKSKMEFMRFKKLLVQRVNG